MVKHIGTTLEQLSEQNTSSLVTKPEGIRTKEDVNEWKAQYYIKLGLVISGFLLICYGGYLTTRVLLVYKDLLSQSEDMLPFQSGIAFLIIPIFIAGITFVLAAAKLLTKHNKDEDDSNFDKFMAAINPVINAINLYLRSKTSN